MPNSRLLWKIISRLLWKSILKGTDGYILQKKEMLMIRSRLDIDHWII
jgi:hypothetical protein